MKNMLNCEIITELAQGINDLSPTAWNAARVLAPVFYKEAEKRGADMHLLGVIGSWGDTLEDDEVLRKLKEYYKNQVKFDRLFTSGITAEIIHSLELITFFFFGFMCAMIILFFISN